MDLRAFDLLVWRRRLIMGGNFQGEEKCVLRGRK